MNNVEDKSGVPSRDKGVAFFPTAKELSGNPYWPMLAEELEKKGFFVNDLSTGPFDLNWLIKNHTRVRVINFHFVQQFYKSTTLDRKFVKLVIFSFNMLLARILGYRTIFTLHNLEATYPLLPKWLDFLGHWVAANFSERIIVYCNEGHRLLTKRYGRRNGVFYVDHPNVIHYYPNDITKECARKHLNLPKNSFVFTFIGGVRPNKGVELLIQAFLKLKNSDYRLVIAGNIYPPPSYAQSLQEMAAGDDRISFVLKHIPNEEIQVFLNAADIVVLPFARILTSGTANLAMSFARPVIVPRMGCLPELVEPEYGWLFNPDDPNSLAEVMGVAASSDADRVGEQAYKKMVNYSPERFAQQTLKAYFG